MSETTNTQKNQPVGTSIYVDESDDIAAEYTLVRMGYTDGTCQLWRRCTLNVSQPMDENGKISSYEGSKVDTYLQDFYNSLPESTQNYIVKGSYPIVKNGSLTNQSRQVCIPSDDELLEIDTAVSEGSLFTWLYDPDTRNGYRMDENGQPYWTRSRSSSSSSPYTQFKCISSDGKSNYAADSLSYKHVRPCFCVSENQPVQKDNGIWHLVESGQGEDPDKVLVAPYGLHINSVYSGSNQPNIILTDQGLNEFYQLEWSMSDASSVSQYEVYCSQNGSEFKLIATAGTECAFFYGPDSNGVTAIYKVKACADPASGYADSPQSDDYCTVITIGSSQKTCCYCYRGDKWVTCTMHIFKDGIWKPLSSQKHYSNGAWNQIDLT